MLPQPDLPNPTPLPDTESTPARVSFTAIAVTRSWEQIVRQIEAAIHAGEFARGQKLPTERELAATFDVSRSVVREAIKVLSAMGLVEARQGSGLYVRNDPVRSVTRAFVLSVSPDAESVEKLFEFRIGLERDAARFAAQRRTDADIEALAAASAETASARDPIDWTRFGVADNRFHEAIARAAGNPYLGVAITTARQMQRDVVNLFSQHPGSIDTAIRHHHAIYTAIRDCDPDLAADLMAEHIEYTRHAVQTKLPLAGGPNDASSGGAP